MLFKLYKHFEFVIIAIRVFSKARLRMMIMCIEQRYTTCRSYVTGLHCTSELLSSLHLMSQLFIQCNNFVF
jgi:hypothetical protein